jgi:GDP-D-mannose 3',5'-epimerase
MSEKIVVCGAGGFVGGRLVKRLWDDGHRDIRAVSFRPADQWLYVNPQVDNRTCDLRDYREAATAIADCRWIYNLAAKVGGLGYIKAHTHECYLSSIINMNLLRAASRQDTGGYFFASSACVYGRGRELNPTPGYAEEKLFSEHVCNAFALETKLPVKIARYQNIYGAGDDTKGTENRDHAPAALARKVVAAKLSGVHEINIWGDGSQIRNFVHINDVVEATLRIMGTPCGPAPIDVGSEEAVSINALVDMLEEIAAVKLTRFYSMQAPIGVTERKCDNAYLRAMVGWSPTRKLMDGLRELYNNIWEQRAFAK